MNPITRNTIIMDKNTILENSLTNDNTTDITIKIVDQFVEEG
jgi:hypothetical protein